MPPALRCSQWANVSSFNDKSEVRAILEELPLGHVNLIEFDYVELSLLTPLHMLLDDASASPSK
jgi:hypothetical protein